MSGDLSQLLSEVHLRTVSVELAALAACLALAWAICRWFGRDQPKNSIWFGRHTVDGLMFPLLALLFSDLARRAAIGFQPVLLRIAVPVLL